MSDVKRAAVGPPAEERFLMALHNVGGRGQTFRLRDAAGHFGLVVNAGVILLERRDHRKDGRPMLAGLGAPGSKRAAVTNAFDIIPHRRIDVSGAEEVSVHGMDRTVRVDGPARSDDCLGEYLSSKDPAPGSVLGRPEEAGIWGIVAWFEIQCFEETREWVGHCGSVRLGSGSALSR